MKTQNIFSKVGSILTEVNEQYQYLSESPDNLNEIELELLSANADFLAEHVRVLKKLNLSKDNPSKPAENAIILSPVDVEKQQEEIDDVFIERQQAENLTKQELPESYSTFYKPVENDSFAISTPVENIEFKETEQQEEPEPVTEEVDSTPYIEPVSTPNTTFNTFFTPEANPVKVPQYFSHAEELAPEPPLVNEVIIDESPVVLPAPVEEPAKIPTINDLISAQRTQQTAETVVSKQPVSDLKYLINLNDKLLFIKDLFNGYSLAYSEAIEIINRFDSFESADNFLQTNYANKNNWMAKQATADKFYELLNRRFGKG